MSETSLNILLVEDNVDHAELIRRHLTRGQGDRVSIAWSQRVSEALSELDKRSFDVVLLDMMLPDSRGVETVGRVHGHTPGVPIVVLTSAEGDEVGIGAVQHGAEDYIAKSAMDSHSLTRSIRYAIERSERRRAESALEGARYELSLAQKIQSGLYPTKPPPLAGFDLAGTSRPAASVGGDYFDYFPLPDGKTGIGIGDVSGHGIGPAILMAETRAALRTLARTSRCVGEALTLANHILLDGLAEGRYITLLLTYLDPASRTLTFANAGHPDGLIFGPDGSIVHRMSSVGTPLGVLADEAYESSGPIALESGQVVLLVTDGILEAWSPGLTKPFGQERLTALVRENRALPAAQLLARIDVAIRDYCRPSEPLDDTTAVAMKVL